jgi:hypothetical protein
MLVIAQEQPEPSAGRQSYAEMFMQVTSDTMKPNWPIVAVYDERCREQAVNFCDSLVQRFWTTADLDVHGASVSNLNDHATFRNSSAKAVGAKFIVFALRPGGEMPSVVCDWIESWLALRGDREGAIVALNDPGAGLGTFISQKFVYLRNVANRTAMDYLTELPNSAMYPIPDSLDSYSARADQVTSVLDQILHKPVPPPRMLS